MSYFKFAYAPTAWFLDMVDKFLYAYNIILWKQLIKNIKIIISNGKIYWKYVFNKFLLTLYVN